MLFNIILKVLGDHSGVTKFNYSLIKHWCILVSLFPIEILFCMDYFVV